MEYLALHREQLSRFSHHWFWGLQVDKTEVNTLYDAARYLEAHPDEQDAIASQLKSTSRFFWMVRVVYWIFNIDNYRNNYYSLHAYVSLQHYEQGVSMLTSAERESAAVVGGFILLALAFRYSEPLGRLVGQAVTPGLDWFKGQLLRSLPSELPTIRPTESPLAQSAGELVPLIRNKNRFYLPSECEPFQQPGLLEDSPSESDSSDLEKCFIVKSHLLFAFKRLGLTPKGGDYMSLSTLKAAYRESLRRSHPDKTGVNSASDFHHVREGMSFILDGIHYGNQQNESISNTLAQFKSKIGLLEEKLQSEIQAWKALRGGIGNYNKRVDGYIVNQDKLIENQDKLIASQDKLTASQDKLIATQDRYIQTIKEYCESEAKLHQNYFEALALQEEYEALAQAELLSLETIIPFASERDDMKVCSPCAYGADNPYRFMASGSRPNTPEITTESRDSEPGHEISSQFSNTI